MSIKLTSKSGGLAGSLSINATEVLTITEDGNVGIGTTSPNGLLDVANRGITKDSLPEGTILQVVEGRLTSDFATSSVTPVDIGLSASITPTSTSSKIRVDVFAYWAVSETDAGGGGVAQILRGATQISETGVYLEASGITTLYVESSCCMSVVDSPSTTSSTTYKVQVKGNQGADSIDIYATASRPAVIILTEIAG